MSDLIYKYWLQRFETCQRCTFSKTMLLDIITCGTPVVGEVVRIEGKDVKLCGCIMKLKAKLESATCPLDFWKDDNHTN